MKHETCCLIRPSHSGDSGITPDKKGSFNVLYVEQRFPSRTPRTQIHGQVRGACTLPSSTRVRFADALRDTAHCRYVLRRLKPHLSPPTPFPRSRSPKGMIIAPGAVTVIAHRSFQRRPAHRVSISKCDTCAHSLSLFKQACKGYVFACRQN